MLKNTNPTRLYVAIAAVSAAALVSGCGVGEASTSDEAIAEVAAAPLPVEVVSPVKTEILATYHTTATLNSDAEAPVLARVEGEVVEILVEEGDLVMEGQVLAALDGDRLRLEMNAARANLDMARREHERMISLHERGLVSAAAFEGMQFNVDALQAVYELKRLNVGYTKIRAPISGVVSARDIKLGQHLSVNDATFRVTDVSLLVAHLKIPQSELARIAVGNQAEIRVDAMPDQVFTATVDRISPTIDMKNGTFRATAYVENDGGLLAPGMFGRFDIAYERHEDALTIPSDAVIAEDNVSVVYIVEDGEAVRRIVETGIQNNGVVEVLSGIAEHDRIVVTGQNSLRDGSRVLASVTANQPITG